MNFVEVNRFINFIYNSKFIHKNNPQSVVEFVNFSIPLDCEETKSSFSLRFYNEAGYDNLHFYSFKLDGNISFEITNSLGTNEYFKLHKEYKTSNLDVDSTKYIGALVYKGSLKKFKSGRTLNRVKGVVVHEKLQIPAFTFYDDESVVECRRCFLNPVSRIN